MWEFPHWRHPGSGGELNILIFLQREQLKFRGTAWKSFQTPSWSSLGKICSLKNFRGKENSLVEWKRQEKWEWAFPGWAVGTRGILGVIPIPKSRNWDTSEESKAIPSVLPIPHFPLFHPKGSNWMCFPQSCGSPLSQQEYQHFLQDTEFPCHRSKIPARTCKSMMSPFPKCLKTDF